MGEAWRRHRAAARRADDRRDGHRLAIGRCSPLRVRLTTTYGAKNRANDGAKAIEWRRVLGAALSISAAFLAVFLAVAPKHSHAEPAPVEYEVKAAFVLNFGSLVEWPEHTFETQSSEMVFCLVASEEVGATFEQSYRESRVGTHPVSLRLVSSPDEMSGCHIAFITASYETPSQPFVDAASGLPILTIGEADRFANDGGIISFFAQGTKIRFEINNQIAESVGLRISSRLLRLARIVSSESE